MLAGCSQNGTDDNAKGSTENRTEDSAKEKASGSESDGAVTVELKVTGDSPANVYVPGIKSYLYTDTKKTSGDMDLDLEGVKTPWSKKFKVKPGRSLSLQAGSPEPKKEIGCQILIDGKLVDQETKKNKPGYTLTAGCNGVTPG